VKILSLLTLLLAGGAYEASAKPIDPITIFGLPLGGKLNPSFRQCSMKEIGTDVRSLCWTSPPSMHKGWRDGSVIVPGAETRPSWAANGSFTATVAKDGTLGELRVKTYPVDKFEEIMRSIELRFGRPTSVSPLPSQKAMLASWNRTEIKIELICAPKIDCYTTFTSPGRAAVLGHEKKLQSDKESARPLSM